MDRGRIKRALSRAREDAEAGGLDAPPDGRPRPRRVAIGDPQAPIETFLEVLDRHGLLGDGGRLLPDVQLVSMGDHFDWGGPTDRERAADSAEALLSWLAAHPADQVVLLLGNHDLGRVSEVSSFDDATFRAAQVEADAAYRGGEVDEAAERAFLARYPELPSAEVLARDFGTFRVRQRELVTRLLRSGRFRIAHAAAPDRLLCHAGVTRDDLDGIGVPEAAQGDAREVAAALNTHLDRALAGWSSGRLELEPLHRGGSGQTEGRGIFYQRPCHPACGPQELFEGPPRRRFDPRLLPLGLTQAIGHIRDKKCRTLLRPWCSPEPAVDGPLRHLQTDGEAVIYAQGTPPRAAPGAATMLFLDCGMSYVAPERYELLDLVTWRPAMPAR